MFINYLIPIFLSILPSHSNTPTTAACHTQCGQLPIKYPFGTTTGCGNPNFTTHIQCTSNKLQYTTPSTTFTVTSLDYAAATAVLSDPFMSTCSSMQNSGSLTFPTTSPFTVSLTTAFVLLGCSRTSPVFDPMSGFCDSGSGRRLCEGLYSCKGVPGSVESCCVYDPVGLGLGTGLGLGLDLPKLQCSSYSAVYGFGGREGDPMRWEYGIMVKYNGSGYDRSDVCRSCEESGGFCGYEGLEEAFSCKCGNGVNTSVNCYGRGSVWSGTRRERIQTALTNGGLLLLAWMIALF